MMGLLCLNVQTLWKNPNNQAHFVVQIVVDLKRMNPKNKTNPLNGRNQNMSIHWVVLVILARSLFLILYQGLLACHYASINDPEPWGSAAQWWTVYGTAVDISCLILLAMLLKREGKGLFSLLDFDRTKVISDIKKGFLVFILIFPLIGFLYSSGMGKLILNETSYNLISGQLALRTLPSWGFYYSVFVWWFIWSMTEELTYQAFGLNRLLKKFGRTKAVLFVGFFWAIQHSFLPLIFDWPYILWRFVSFLPLVIGLMIAYMKIGRITPLIFAHALMDINAAVWTFNYWE